jgi:hypothetical protein
VDGGFLLFQSHVSRIAYFRPSGPQSGLRFGIPRVILVHYCGFKGVIGREVRQPESFGRQKIIKNGLI